MKISKKKIIIETNIGDELTNLLSSRLGEELALLAADDTNQTKLGENSDSLDISKSES